MVIMVEDFDVVEAESSSGKTRVVGSCWTFRMTLGRGWISHPGIQLHTVIIIFRPPGLRTDFTFAVRRRTDSSVRYR